MVVSNGVTALRSLPWDSSAKILSGVTWLTLFMKPIARPSVRNSEWRYWENLKLMRCAIFLLTAGYATLELIIHPWLLKAARLAFLVSRGISLNRRKSVSALLGPTSCEPWANWPLAWLTISITPWRQSWAVPNYSGAKSTMRLWYAISKLFRRPLKTPPPPCVGFRPLLANPQQKNLRLWMLPAC